jgi:hypothetical protein
MANKDTPLIDVITDAWSKDLTIKQTAAQADQAGYFVSRNYIKKSFDQMNATFKEFCALRADRKISKYHR